MIEVSKDTLYVRGEDGTFKPVNVFGAGGGAYELIETITVDEAVKAISRFNEPNGAKYNFESIKVEVVVPAAEAQSYVTLDYTTVADSRYGGFYVNDGIRTSVTRYMFFISPMYDNLIGFYTNPVTNDYDTIRWWIPAIYKHVCRKKSPITMLSFVTQTEFPAGTVISIFGVKANA